MNNEETIIMQPQNTQNNKAAESKNETKNEANNTKEVKNEGKGNTAQRVGATIAAGVGGGAIGGGAAAYAANQMNEEPVEEEVKVEPAPEPAPQPEPTPQAEEPKEEEIIVEPDDTVEPDYPGYGGADPVVNEPQPQQTGDEGGQEIQVLGVYENEEGQEMAVLTDGETIAAVVDTTGDGDANIIAVDENHNGQFEEGEIHDITPDHLSMEPLEQEYLAQQQMEMEQQDTFAYNAADETDYNNDVDTYDMV